jgi:haloalkane dehalogenase
VPTSPDDPESAANRQAWTVLEQWTKPFVCCFSDRDPITAGAEAAFLDVVPGTAGQPHITTTNAHHFFQEDAAPQLAQLLIDVMSR